MRFLALLAACLAIICQKTNPPHITIGIRDFGLNITLASTQSIAVGLESAHRLYGRKGTISTNNFDTKCSGRFLLFILLLGGDIQINPGPNYKYLCGVCSKPVKSNQKYLQCDNCNLRYHTKCCRIHNDMCNSLLAKSSCVWMCPQCDLPNFSNSFLDNSSELNLNNSFSALDSLITSNSEHTKAQTKPSNTAPKPSRRKLKGMIINCNGLKSISRSNELKALLDLHNPDFVLGTESKLEQDIPSYSIFPSNYAIFRNDRNRNGGGVFQAVRSDLVCTEEPDFINDCEIIWTSLKLSNCKTLYLSAFYRPPNSITEVLDKFHDSISRVFDKSLTHPNVIIGGDFNLGDIDWASDEPAPRISNSASQHNKFLHLIDDFSLSQHVKSTTRPASGKILDLLLSTYPNSVLNTTTVSGISDHLAVVFEVNLKPSRVVKPPHKIYNYKKADFIGLNDHMLNSSSLFFSSNPENRSVEENWISFKHALSDGINQFIPQKSSRPRFNLPCITLNIKREMRRKDRLHKKAVQTKKSQHWNSFKYQRNYVSKLIKESHVNYLNKIIGSSLTENPKKFWSYVKNSKSESIGIPPLEI